jgi:hypothetical protein
MNIATEDKANWCGEYKYDIGEAWAVTVTPIPKFQLPLTLLSANFNY